MDREIPDQHLAPMRAMCALEESAEFPEKLSAKYWSLRYCLDRVGGAVLVGDLARMCVECGFGKPTARQLAGPTVVDLWRLKKIKAGDALTVEWAGKKVSAKLVRITAMNEVAVTLKDDPEERLVSVEKASLAAAA